MRPIYLLILSLLPFFIALPPHVNANPVPSNSDEQYDGEVNEDEFEIYPLRGEDSESAGMQRHSGSSHRAENSRITPPPRRRESSRRPLSLNVGLNRLAATAERQGRITHRVKGLQHRLRLRQVTLEQSAVARERIERSLARCNISSGSQSALLANNSADEITHAAVLSYEARQMQRAIMEENERRMQEEGPSRSPNFNSSSSPSSRSE